MTNLKSGSGLYFVEPSGRMCRFNSLFLTSSCPDFLEEQLERGCIAETHLNGNFNDFVVHQFCYIVVERVGLICSINVQEPIYISTFGLLRKMDLWFYLPLVRGCWLWWDKSNVWQTWECCHLRSTLWWSLLYLPSSSNRTNRLLIFRAKNHTYITMKWTTRRTRTSNVP